MTLIRTTLPLPRLAVAISGGVDSAVAAALLKHNRVEGIDSSAYDLVGVFMRNWDGGEEGAQGWREGVESSASSSSSSRSPACRIEADFRDAERVCKQLSIPLFQLDFVSTYYTDVFEPFLEGLRRGGTPNPDVVCNRVVKFDRMLEACVEGLGAGVVATGHYARVEGGKLLRGVDAGYDQTYFLAGIEREVLGDMAQPRVVFPVGGLTKETVRWLAGEFGLARVEGKKSSTGICFIGKRRFGDFVEEYLAPRPGVFVDVDTKLDGLQDVDGGSAIGRCRNMHALTYGQNAGIGGLASKAFVAGKDLERDVVYIAQGRNHPSLYTRRALVEGLHWLSEAHKQTWAATGRLSGVQCKARYREPLREVVEMRSILRDGEDPGRPARSQLWVLDDSDKDGDGEHHQPDHGEVWIEFAEPAFAITPQQYIVLYDGDVCVASARIKSPGLTLHEERAAETNKERET